MTALAREIKKRPEAYQHELAEQFGVSQRGIGKALKRLGLSRNKKRSHIPQLKPKLGKLSKPG